VGDEERSKGNGGYGVVGNCTRKGKGEKAILPVLCTVQ